ncbi:DUF3592 domain-containing protein [Streptomyces sp. NPDC058463]|uniref:DUF3592 domain-containing protein n=1 Tax=Streptomyces sp. NPDC058463 TaxID=3346510 RepID=UPI0036524F85
MKPPDSGREFPALGWSTVFVAVFLLAWFVFRPFDTLWMFVGTGSALALLKVLRRLVSRHPTSRIDRWCRTNATPALFLAHLRRGENRAWLHAAQWRAVRRAGMFAIVCTIAVCFMGWDAWKENQALNHLRSRGQEVTATVVSVTGWSDADEALHVDVRFETQSGPARTNVDLEGDSVGSKPGDRLTVVYDPVRPATVRLPSQLDGRGIDGLVTGMVVLMLLALFVLAHAIRDQLRAGRR